MVVPLAVPNTTPMPPLSRVPFAVPPDTRYRSPPLDSVVLVAVPKTTCMATPAARNRAVKNRTELR